MPMPNFRAISVVVVKLIARKRERDTLLRAIAWSESARVIESWALPICSQTHRGAAIQP